MKSISISILGKSYKISLDDEFHGVLSNMILRDLGSFNINDIKTLLNAYIKRCNEIHNQEKEISDIHANIEEKTK